MGDGDADGLIAAVSRATLSDLNGRAGWCLCVALLAESHLGCHRKTARRAERRHAMCMTEAQCLSSFDTMRTATYAAAQKVYAKSRCNINILTATDLG